MKPSQWMDVQEVAKYLGVSKETIYRLLEREQITAHRVGRLWRFRPQEVDKDVVKGRLTL